MNSTVQQDPLNSWRDHFVEALIVTAIASLGLGLRLFRLDYQGLWYDEARSVYVSRLTFSEMIQSIVEVSWNHPPLYYYTLRLWYLMFGSGDFQARLLSVIFGTLSIVLIYILARTLFDRWTAIVAAFLLAVSQLGIMYSQEARPYAQLMFFVILTICLFSLALRGNKQLIWWGFIFSAILMIYINYYSLLVLLVLFIYIIIYRKQYDIPVRILIGGAVLGLVIIVPWLANGVVKQALKSSALFTGQPVWFVVGKGAFFDVINAFNNGKVAGLLSTSPGWTFAMGGVLFTLPAVYALKPLVWGVDIDEGVECLKANLILLLLLWVLPIATVLLVSRALHIQYDLRYILFCIIPYYILVARGVRSLNSSILTLLFFAFILGYSAYALQSNYFKSHKENYRDALAYLAKEYIEGDCVLFLPFNEVPLQWKIYHGDDPNLRVTDVESIASGEVDCDRVWAIAYRRVHQAKKETKKGLKNLEITHKKTNESKYLFVHAYLYESKLSVEGD